MADKIALTHTVIFAQVIDTTWGKRSRGAPLAALRNAVPERLPLPDVRAVEQQTCIVHRATYSEVNQFAGSVRENVEGYMHVHTPLTEAVGLYLTGDTLRVMFEGPYPYQNELPQFIDARMGAPRRTVPRRPFALHAGEWGQVRYMGRWVVGYEGVTTYEKWVCNIGWFRELSSRVFLDSRPDHRFDSMPDVW